MPADAVVANIDRVGNTSAASIPLALADARADGTLVPGHRVLLSAFGAGLTWGSTVLRWPDLGQLS
jgi:3-oxoacyl-[acyl-carrier-protein] synthase-3